MAQPASLRGNPVLTHMSDGVLLTLPRIRRVTSELFGAHRKHLPQF